MAARKVPISDKSLLNLIKEINKRPCIWNLDYEHYNERGRIATAWEEISATLNLPEDLLRAKWKNLRDLFKREIKKYDVKTLENYNGKWRHFKHLWFLHRPGDHVEFSEEESASDTDNKDGIGDQLAQKNPAEFEVYIEDTEPKLGRKRLMSETDEQDPFLEKKIKYDDDEFDMMFLKSLTPYFRDLEPWRKLVVRNKIQDIILSELAAQGNYGLMQH